MVRSKPPQWDFSRVVTEMLEFYAEQVRVSWEKYPLGKGVTVELAVHSFYFQIFFITWEEIFDQCVVWYSHGIL